MKDRLLNLVSSRKLTVGIIGLGYVGLPLAVAFAKKGVSVLGFDKSQPKVDKLGRAENYIADVTNQDLTDVVRGGFLKATTDFTKISECQAVIICVPTPLDHFKKPDISYIEEASAAIGKYMRPGTFVALESTTYPTTTEMVVQPILQKESGLIEGKDFWLCFSPERVDPGNKSFKTDNTPKVIGGIGKDALEVGIAVYGLAIQHLHPVSSPRAAEMVKILENTYRLINISLINELALLSNRMDIDIWEVIEAAKTKPYGFQAFYPGPGVGGHCIPLDPFYLEYVAKNFNFDLTMITTAGQINNLMPHKMLVKISFALNKQKKALNGSKVTVLGLAYKKDIADERESPALHIVDELIHKGAIVQIHDPFVMNTTTEGGNKLTSIPLTAELLKSSDCVVIATDHSAFDGEWILANSPLVVDLRNVVKGKSEKLFKL